MLVQIGFLYLGSMVLHVIYDTVSVQFLVTAAGHGSASRTMHKLPLGPQHIARGRFHIHRLHIDTTAFKHYECWKALDAHHFSMQVEHTHEKPATAF